MLMLTKPLKPTCRLWVALNVVRLPDEYVPAPKAVQSLSLRRKPAEPVAYTASSAVVETLYVCFEASRTGTSTPQTFTAPSMVSVRSIITSEV